MMRVFTFFLTLGFGSIVFAGGDWSDARISKFGFNRRNQVVFELDWISGNGFLSKSDYRKFAFEFHNWPSASHRWFHQALPWTPSDDKIYPLEDVAACQNFLLKAFADKSVVRIGQMGTVSFRPSTSTENAGVIPYAKVIRDEKGEVCLLYASPI